MYILSLSDFASTFSTKVYVYTCIHFEHYSVDCTLLLYKRTLGNAVLYNYTYFGCYKYTILGCRKCMQKQSVTDGL